MPAAKAAHRRWLRDPCCTAAMSKVMAKRRRLRKRGHDALSPAISQIAEA